MNIVLAHGILGFDKIGNVSYFNGVGEYLKGRYHVNVMTAEVSPTGGIVERGDKLRTEILAWLGKTGNPPTLNPEEDTHIIAHSMGGLDSRYILSPKNENNIAQHITSLTTIATPHRGSPLADFFYQGLDGKSPFLAGKILENLARQSLKSLLGVSTDGLRDLTTEEMVDFNGTYVDNDKVHYFWAAGIGRPDRLLRLKTSWVLWPTYKLIQSIGKAADDRDNDGAVPLSSARHGEAIGEPWMADHLDEVGHDLDYLPLGMPDNYFGYLGKYDEIMARITPLTKQK